LVRHGRLQFWRRGVQAGLSLGQRQMEALVGSGDLSDTSLQGSPLLLWLPEREGSWPLVWDDGRIAGVVLGWWRGVGSAMLAVVRVTGER